MLRVDGRSSTARRAAGGAHHPMARSSTLRVNLAEGLGIIEDYLKLNYYYGLEGDI